MPLYAEGRLLYARRPEPMITIDIHPHIIASDTTRYPLAPLGGHQSDWSRTPAGDGGAAGRRHG